MNRRAFIRALGLAPLAVPVVAAAVKAEAPTVDTERALDSMVVAAQKAADPPLLTGLDHLEGETIVVLAS